MTRELIDMIRMEVYNRSIPEKIANKERCRFKSNEDREDYIQEMYLTLFQMPDEKVATLYKKKEIYDYFARVCINQLINDKSTYNKLMEHNIEKVQLKEQTYDDDE